jgi:hypothetical protein
VSKFLPYYDEASHFAEWSTWRAKRIAEDVSDADSAALGSIYVPLIASYELQKNANQAPMPGMVQFVEAYFENFWKDKNARRFKVSWSTV